MIYFPLKVLTEGAFDKLHGKFFMEHKNFSVDLTKLYQKVDSMENHAIKHL